MNIFWGVQILKAESDTSQGSEGIKYLGAGTIVIKVEKSLTLLPRLPGLLSLGQNLK